MNAFLLCLFAGFMIFGAYAQSGNVLNLAQCHGVSPLNIEYYVSPRLFYLRPTELDITDPSLSSVPEYWALSAGAIAMTSTINQLFSQLQTLHYGSPSLFNVPVPVVLNQLNESQCLFWASLSIIPQYNLTVMNIGAGNSYIEEGVQGRQNNRDSCEVCSNTTGADPFAMIHGELNSAELFDITAQICNAFGVPTIAATVTDTTFQELFPQAVITAEWSAVAATGSQQVGFALNAFTYQYQWYSAAVFVDTTDTNQFNYMRGVMSAAALGTVFAYMDPTDTGCASGIQSIISSGVSVIYLDMDISRCQLCAYQLLTSGLLQQNYILIWGQTLMTSVGNSIEMLEIKVGLPLSFFTGSFILQVRTQQASFVPLLNSYLDNLFFTWNDANLTQFRTKYSSQIQDNANAVILASQGVYGLLSNELFSFSYNALPTNFSTNVSSSDLVNFLTSNFLNFVSKSTDNGPFSVIQSGSSTSPWKIQLPLASLQLQPNDAFYYYTQDSGMWSAAANMAQWYHDDQGNALPTFDVYNIQQTRSVFIGSSFNGIWKPNLLQPIVWPNLEALWQYVSGWPSDHAPLLSLTLACSTNISCSSDVDYAGIAFFGYRQVVAYSTEATLTDSGSWEIQISCPGSGVVPSYTVSSLTPVQDNDPWTLTVNHKTGLFQVKFNSSVLEPGDWKGRQEALFSFLCADKTSVLNGTLEIIVTNDPSQYTPTSSQQSGLVAANAVGVLVCVVGAFSTLLYRRHKPISYASVPFLLISWVGFGLLFGSGIASIVPVTSDEICQTKSWLFNYGFVAVMGSFFLKTFSLHLIFNNKKLTVRKLSIWQFTLALLAMLSTITVVMMVWQVDSRTQLHRQSDFQPYCVSKSLIPFHFIGALAALLVLSCFWVNYQTRRIPQAYNESKCIAIVVYSAAVAGITWWVLASQVSLRPSTMSLLTSLFLCVITYISTIIYFLPKFYALCTENVAKALTATPKNSGKKNSAIQHMSSLGIDSGSGYVDLEGLPSDPKLALQEASDELLKAARVWTTTDIEEKRLTAQLQKCGVGKDKQIAIIGFMTNLIRNLMTIPDVTRDCGELVERMKRVLTMSGVQLAEEAKKHEENTKKKLDAANAAISKSPKTGARQSAITAFVINSPPTTITAETATELSVNDIQN